jgi:CubicO group peptidase (beta-lactamase class C family)
MLSRCSTSSWRSTDRVVVRELERQGLPGLEVAVGPNARVVYSHAVGKADVENGVARTAASLIRTGSIAAVIRVQIVLVSCRTRANCHRR